MAASGRWFAWLVGVAALATLVAVVLHLTEAREFVVLAERARPAALIAALVLQAGTYFAQAAVWRTGASRRGVELPVPFAARLAVAKLFVDQALPSLGASGTALVARALTQRGVPGATVTSIVALDTASFYVAYCTALLVALVVLLRAHELTPLLLGASMLLFAIAALVVATVVVLPGRQPHAAGRHLPSPLRRAIALLRGAEPDVVRSPRTFARAGALQLAIVLLDAATLWTMLLAVGFTPPPGAVYAAFVIASVFRSVGVSPGGLGTFEAAAVAALGLAHVPLAPALAATLLFRGVSFWLPMLPGLLWSRRLARRTTHGGDGATSPALWARPIDEVLAELHTTRDGLSREEAARRLAAHGPNQLASREQATLPALLWRQVRSPLQLLLLFAAVASVATGEWLDAGIVIAIVVASAGLGCTREYRAQTAAARLRRRIEARATVLRDGHPCHVPLAEVVPGDVAVLAAGSLVPADALVLDATELLVDEAPLTGESFPAAKAPGAVGPGAPLARRSNCLYLGTHVRSGQGVCVAVATGAETEFGRIAARLRETGPETEFERAIGRFGVMLLESMTLLLVAILVANLLLGRPVIETVLFSIALAVGLSPELLPAILSVNLARGAQAMAARGVLVRRLDAIENLGSMDVLCTDKTGTLTEGVVRLGGAWDPAGVASAHVRELAATNAALQGGLPNPLDEAILADARAAAWRVDKLAELPYDFVRRRLGVVVRDPGGVPLLVTKGTVASVLDASTTIAGGEPLTAAARTQLREREAAWTREGIRVLGVATRRLDARDSYGRECEAELAFEGFVTFLDRPKPGIADTIRALAQAGVQLRIVTGDSLAVALHVAREVGLGTTHVLTGQTIDATPDAALRPLVENAEICAEVNPQQKERIVRALRTAGHVVGFLGDGINDTPAMHAADAAISVESAVDVAREAADFVLLERDVEVIRRGIDEGRRTLANTLKYVLTTTSANLGNMISMAVASLFLPFLPLLAGQVLLNNFLSDLPAIALANDRVDPEWLARPRRWELRTVRRFMVQFGLLSSVFDFATFGLLLWLFSADAATFRTGWFVESLLTELAVALVVRTQRPAWQSRPGTSLVVATALVAAVAFAIPYLPAARELGFVPVDPLLLACVAAIVGLYVAAAELLKRWFYRPPRTTGATP